MPCLHCPPPQAQAGLHRRESACELRLRGSHRPLSPPLPSPPSAQAAPICLQARGKLLLEKPRPQAGEVAVLPPSVGQTTHTSAAHQTHSRVLGGICSPKTALSLNGCPRYPFYPDFDFLMEIHSVNHPAVHPELWRWPWPGGRYAPKSHVWRCPANSLHTTGTGS